MSMLDSQVQQSPQAAEAPPRDRLLSFIAWTAVVHLAALAVAGLAPLVSRETSVVTAPASALATVAVATAAWLLMAYPLWPGTLLGGVAPQGRFWKWFLLRAAEAASTVLIALPFWVAAAVFAGEGFARLAEVAAGLSGAALAAIGYRYVHVAYGERLRAWAILDVAILVFAPLAAGYLLLEFGNIHIGWCWLISPLAVAREVALNGLVVQSAAFLVGLVGYGAVSALALLVLQACVKRFNTSE